MRGLVLGVLLCLISCTAGRQHRTPAFQIQPALFSQDVCEAVFPENGWQFVHTVSCTLPGGKRSVILGVTTLKKESIQSALMTIEGLTLVEAEVVAGEKIHIRQALPPFDRPDFAQGLMEDILTIFRKPPGVGQRGKTAGKTQVCRYTGPAGGVTDVYPMVDDCWGIKKYSAKQELERTVFGCQPTLVDATAFPSRLKLESFGMAGYSLTMNLLSAVPVQ